MGSQNARWHRTGWIYSPELSYSVVVPEGRHLHLGEAKCLDSHPLLLQPFACPGLLGTPLLYSLLQKNHPFAFSDFSPAAAPAAPCWQERREGEEKGGEAGRAARLLPAAVTGSALDVALDARRQPGHGPCHRAPPALGGGTGCGLPGMHQSIQE